MRFPLEVGRSFISTTVCSLIKHKIIANSSACKIRGYCNLCITISAEKVTKIQVSFTLGSSSVIMLLCLWRAKSIMTVIAHERSKWGNLNTFKKNKFLSDLEQMPWSNVDLCSDPNDMWQEWKQVFVSCMDKNAPRKLKRISKKRVPCMDY